MEQKFLKSGDTIYLVAPSFGATTYPYDERLKISIQFLKNRGYKIIEGPNIYLDKGVFASNTPLLRAKEIEDAFASDADFIWSVGGGETMIEILPYLDFEKIRKSKPKYFMGYSDNTNLTYLLQTHLDFKTIYGSNASSFYNDDIYIEQLLKAIEGDKHFEGYPLYQSLKESKGDLSPLNCDTKKVISTINYTKPLEGILLGGCLDSLVNLCGTRFDKTKEYLKKHDNVIFFLESCDFNVLSYRRALFQLKEAGYFSNIKGIILGRPMLIGQDIGGLSFNDCVKDILGDLNIPLIMDIDIGHLPPTVPLRTNEECVIKVENNNIIIEYK